MAITLVLMRHFFDLFMKGYEGPLAHFFSWGWHGVDLFFALSGFLIGGQIIEECAGGRFSFRNFFLKRTFRIIPPYLIAIFVCIAYFSFKSGFLILRNGEVLKDFLSHVFYLQDYVQAKQMMYNGIYWSLAVEEKFYIVLPLIIFFFYFVLKAGKKRFLLASLGALALFAVGMRFMAYEPGKDFWSAYLVPFHGRFDNLLLGVIAAYIFIHFRDRLSSIGSQALLLIAAAACLSLSFILGGYGTSYFNVCWQFTLTGVGFSALILWLVSIDAGRYLPFKKVFSIVSKYSYTMYLYHILILGLTHNWIKALLAGTDLSLLVFVAYFGAVTAASAVIYNIVDRPFMNWRKRVLERKEREMQAVVSGAGV